MTALTPLERSVLQHLADGKADIQTAAAVRQRVQVVYDIKQKHGPSRERLKQVLAADRMLEQPAPAHVPTAARPGVSKIEDLLAEADEHSNAKIVQKAARIRVLIDELGELVEQDRQAEAARAEVARLEAELNAARQKAGLKPLYKPKPPNGATASSTGHDQQKEWLAKRGVEFAEVLAFARNAGVQSRGSLLSHAARKLWDDAHA